MTTKEKILSLFENNREIYFSGEQIANELSVSRTSVWKAVKSLQNEGYAIQAVTNKGYCLAADTDILSAQGIGKYLQSDSDFLDIHVLSTASSTNTLLQGKALEGIPEGYVIISNEQTKGRGRLGRAFYSPKDTGFYMSLLLRPENCTAAQAVKITTIAAVAMCQAIEETTSRTAGIKWVNDIYLDQKKICGILTEGSFNMENGRMDYAILGLGINVYPPKDGFPGELEPFAGSVLSTHQDDVKNRLCAEFLNHFFSYYHNSSDQNYVEEYRKRSIVIGKWVSVVKDDEIIPALVTEIDDDCHLHVQYQNGQTDCFLSGEIRLRL